MTVKKLIKKLILTVNFAWLTESDLLKKFKSMWSAHNSNSDLLPTTLSPPLDETKADISDLDSLQTQRDNAISLEKSLTEKIHIKMEKIKDTFTGYAPQVQAFINGNSETAKLLGYGEKGIDDGHSDVTVDSITNSRPTIEDVYSIAYLTQAVIVKNNQSGSTAKPNDVDRIEIYELMAEAMPTVIDLKKWTYLGIAKRGKFLNHFLPLEYNLTVFYIAVYVPKKAGGSVVISTGFKSTVQ